VITLTVATTDRHLAEILELQRRNLPRALSREQQSREGFVFAEYTLATLRRMAAELPQAIALHEDRVVGYCLALSDALRAEVPQLAPMFEQFARCSFHGRPLAELRFVVGGQVCVDRAYRGQALLARLYRQLREAVPAGYQLCVTEVAARNGVSLRAHEKLGFEVLARYSADGEEWCIAGWDLAAGGSKR
jgi:hypothetical protein